MEVFRKYLASFGAWYVQVWIDGSLVELPFDHDPDVEEIENWVNELNQSELGEQYGD